MTRGSSLVLAVVLVACAATTPPARDPSAAASQSHKPAQPAECACLDRELPTQFRPDRADDLRTLIQRCLGADSTTQLEQNQRCLPREMGLDHRNRQRVTLMYSCFDMCPTYASARLFYSDIRDRRTCCAQHGVPFEFFGEFIGCMLPEFSDSIHAVACA